MIPARDSVTLEPLGHYYILFPNPAYARTYQNHVLHLQRMASVHTPTSVESPLPIQAGVIIEGEDVHALLRDYALCPPSQKMQLKLMFPHYKNGTRTMLQQRGYPQIVQDDDKTGRAVLFWVDGQQPATPVVKNTIGADGRERGLAWSVSVEKLDTSKAMPDESRDVEDAQDEEELESRFRRHAPSRWILSFADKTEAKRFVRAWHRTPFPSTRGGTPGLVHAEILW